MTRRHVKTPGARSAPWTGRTGSVLAPVLVIALAVGCRAASHEDGPVTRPIAEVLAAHTPDLMKIPGVVGTAESRLPDGRPCVLVLVAKLTPELARALPHELEGYPVKIQETGEIHAMPRSSP